MNKDKIHLEDKEIESLFWKAMDSEYGTVGDGCGSRFSAEALFYEEQNRYERKWYWAHRNNVLSEEMAENPPQRTTWEDFIS